MIRMRMIFSAVVLAVFASSIFAQDVLMTVAGKDVTVDEFERIFRKNNGTLNTKQQTPEEYAELFINFKLKVAEAEALGMDTTAAFLKEYEKYREQLAEPYLTDEETKEELMREAYERAQYDVHASHILVKMNNYAAPEDTLKTWEKIMAIRQRIIDGEDFTTVAKATSDDSSVKDNGGDLGYFTVFQMVYDFESAAYSLEPGQVSMPVRSKYGYHIMQVHDKRPAMGQVKIAHIFVRAPATYSAAEAKAAEDRFMLAYDSIMNGHDFGDIARHNSDDSYSARKGGEIPFFGVGRMFPAFEETAFALKNPGDISKPLKSNYGWHLIKLIEKQPVRSYEEMKSDLQTQAVRGDRSKVKNDRYLKKLMKAYDYELNESAYDYLIERCDTSIYRGVWDPYHNTARFEETLFSTSHGDLKVVDFFDYIYNGQRKRNSIPIPSYVEIRFRELLENFLVKIEKESLEERYPEYRYILQEYHDGILLFDLMDKKVWTQAVEDTLGLIAYHKKNQDKYMWKERVQATIVSCDSTVDMNAVMKKASKIASGKWSQEKVNKKFCSSDTLQCIDFETIKVEKGRNPHVDALNQSKGIGEIYEENGRRKFVIVDKILPPMPKILDETRGQATSDYQDELEDLWLQELRNKYEVKVNQDLLSKIKQ